MICPKCQDLMHTVERRGVHLEQCGRCHGIFLDHGELEQIASAERTYYAPPAAPMHGGGGYRDSPRGYRPPTDSPRPYRGHADSPGPYRGGHGGFGGYGGHYGDSPRPYGQHGHHGKRRHKSFLEQLFD